MTPAYVLRAHHPTRLMDPGTAPITDIARGTDMMPVAKVTEADTLVRSTITNREVNCLRHTL